MTCILRALTAALWLLLPSLAFAQGTVLQSGPQAIGRAPMYVGNGTQAVVRDSGPASGGAIGLGLAEQLLAVRSPTNSYPVANGGSGPLGANWCDYDAPTTNATGYHYLCLSPNAQGGGLLAYGAGGAAAPLPFTFNLNGQIITFGGGSGSTGFATVALPTTDGAVVCFSGTSGLIVPCPGITNAQLKTVPAATFKGNPTATPNAAPTDFTIQSLPARGAPDANNDKVLVLNAATGAFNYTTPGLIAGSATAGVSSLCSLTGALTASQVTACLNLFSSSLQGLVPASAGGTANFLRADGTWAPAGALGGTNGQIQYNNAGVAGGATSTDVSIVAGATHVNSINGVPVNPAGAVTNDVLSYNGTSFVHNAIASLINTVCTASPSTCGALFGYYSASWFGVVGYAPSAGACGPGAGAGPDDTTALTTAANQAFPVRLPSNRCYKITQTVTMTTSGGGLVGDRTATIWMPAASFNSSTLCSTFNCLTSNAVGIYIQGQLTTPFNPITNVTLSGFRILSEVSDGRAVGPIAIRNVTNSSLTNLELAFFPVGVGIQVDSITNIDISGNYIHDFTSNFAWGSAPQIMGMAVDGSRINGLGSRYLKIIKNNLQDIIFGSVTAGLWTQQTVGIGVFTLGSVGEDIISGNTVQDTGEGIDNYSTRSIIVGNMVLSSAQAGIGLKHGASYNVVGHNVLYASGLYGIEFGGDSVAGNVTTNNLIDGNNIFELDQSAIYGSQVTACIRFAGNGLTALPTKNVLQNNYCNAIGGKYGIYGDASDGSGNTYNNNTIINASVANIFTDPGDALPSFNFTVATLPGCNTGTKGLRAQVTDQASAPSFLGALTGGGSITAPVICNGSAWEAG